MDLAVYPYSKSFKVFYSFRFLRESSAASVESFNGKLRDELLNREIFDTLLELRVLLERWRREYNCYRPHSSLGYRPPAPEAFMAEKLSLRVIH